MHNQAWLNNICTNPVGLRTGVRTVDLHDYSSAVAWSMYMFCELQCTSHCFVSNTHLPSNTAFHTGTLEEEEEEFCTLQPDKKSDRGCHLVVDISCLLVITPFCCTAYIKHARDCIQ